MRFNKFLWDNYIRTDRGQEALKRYTRISSDRVPEELRLCLFTIKEEYRHLYSTHDFSGNIVDMVRDAALEYLVDSDESAKDTYSELYCNYIPLEVTNKKGKKEKLFFGVEEEDWYDYVHAISIGLHQAHPEYFLPYEFRGRFHQLEEIHREFGIPLPPVPSKGDKNARALYKRKSMRFGSNIANFTG